jgi:hypothetical protein
MRDIFIALLLRFHFRSDERQSVRSLLLQFDAPNENQMNDLKDMARFDLGARRLDLSDVENWRIRGETESS